MVGCGGVGRVGGWEESKPVSFLFLPFPLRAIVRVYRSRQAVLQRRGLAGNDNAIAR